MKVFRPIRLRLVAVCALASLALLALVNQPMASRLPDLDQEPRTVIIEQRVNPPGQQLVVLCQNDSTESVGCPSS